jgi:hypothetical protein
MSTERFIPRIDTAVLLGSYDPFSNAHGSGSSSSDRESHVFCGFCCDLRRAVLILNSITATFHFLMMIGMFAGFSFLNHNSDSIVDAMDDDVAKEQFESWAEHGNFKAIEALVGILFIGSIAMHGCGIYGAYKFEMWGVVTAAISYAISCLLGLISLNFLHVIVAGVFLYPHVVMIKEMQEDIMTEDNYSSVSSCCCDM